MHSVTFLSYCDVGKQREIAIIPLFAWNINFASCSMRDTIDSSSSNFSETFQLAIDSLFNRFKESLNVSY